jgi:hypothetical protein
MVAFPIFLIEGFYFMLTNADVIIVGMYLPPEKVAVYFAAAKTMALVHFVYFAVKAAAAQRFSGLVSGRRTLPRLRISPADGPMDLLAFLDHRRPGDRRRAVPSLAVRPGFVDGHMIMAVLFCGILAKAMVGPGEVLADHGRRTKDLRCDLCLALAANLASTSC